jgi:hypothetical protein
MTDPAPAVAPAIDPASAFLNSAIEAIGNLQKDASEAARIKREDDLIKKVMKWAIGILIVLLVLFILLGLVGLTTGYGPVKFVKAWPWQKQSFADQAITLPWGMGTVNAPSWAKFDDDQHFIGADDPAVGFYDETEHFATGEDAAAKDFLKTGGDSALYTSADGINLISSAFYGDEPVAGFYGQESAAGDLYGNNPFADEPQNFIGADDPAVGFYDDQNQSFYDEPQPYADEYQGFVPGGVKYSAEDKDDLPWGLGRCKGKSKRGGPAYGSEDYLDAYFAQQKNKALQ